MTRPLRIAVADDEQDMQDYFRTILPRIGHTVVAVAGTGRELIDRCVNLGGVPARSLWAGTFHGIGARILRRHAEVLGYPSTFTIFDADDQKKLIKDIVEVDVGVLEQRLPKRA